MRDSIRWQRVAALCAGLGLLFTCACSSTMSDGAPSRNDSSEGAGPPGNQGTAGQTGSAPPLGIPGSAGSAGAGALPGGATPPPSNAGDEYDAPGTNPFVMTAHDPLSTFGADVDTASYDLLRRDVNLGFLPAPDGVRLEEYVNNFDYDYPEPAYDAEVPFSLQLAAAPSLFADETVVLRIGIQGKAAPPASVRPANLVFLVDVSGSMDEPTKLPLVKQLLSETVDVLAPGDTISIVTYSETADVRLEPTPVSEPAPILGAISALSAGGSTAGAAAIQLAYRQAEAGFIEGGINHIVLCTDGDFNVGIASTPELVALIREKRRTGVTLTALGFGIGNLNDAMMQAVSNAGNGMHGMISSAEHASAYVRDKLLSTVVHIAKDMKIQVEFNPRHVVAYRLLGYENRAIADDDFRDDLVDAGEVGAGLRVTALYQVVRVGGSIPEPANATLPPALDGEPYAGTVEVSPEDLVLVKVRYKHPDATETDPALEVVSALGSSAVAADATALDLDFQWALGVASFAEILKRSPYANPDALPTIGDIVGRPAHESRPDRVEFVELFTRARGLLQTP